MSNREGFEGETVIISTSNDGAKREIRAARYSRYVRPLVIPLRYL